MAVASMSKMEIKFSATAIVVLFDFTTTSHISLCNLSVALETNVQVST